MAIGLLLFLMGRGVRLSVPSNKRNYPNLITFLTNYETSNLILTCDATFCRSFCPFDDHRPYLAHGCGLLQLLLVQDPTSPCPTPHLIRGPL
jgi:hypothetical protein